MVKEKNILVSVAVVYKKFSDGVVWFLIKQDDGTWELPKTNVRKGESSVRAALRMTSEQAAIRAKVLEEVGRAGGAMTVGGQVVPLRYLYYLLVYKDSGEEVLGFADAEWLEYASAVRRLSLKRDRSMLKEAKLLLEKIEKKK